MNKKFVFYSLGKLLEILSFILLIPALIAFFEVPLKSFPGVLFDPRLFGFITAIAASFVCGNMLKFYGKRELIGSGIREGFAIVTFGWFALTLFGSIPLTTYFLSLADIISADTVIRAFTDAYFEIMSGFTTTGATILTNIEQYPQGILFWRSMSHWLGGMGIITLALAILPAFGIASYQMFRGEMPGPTAEQLKPRLAETAKILWGTYVLLTFAETALLKVGGMTLFDAFCHSFGTMATGGFSTKNASIGGYNSAYIEWVVIVFMFFAGMNFIIHYRTLFSRRLDLIKTNREFHFYTGVILVAIILATAVLSSGGISSKGQISKSFRNEPLSSKALEEKVLTERAKIASFPDRLRHAAFQVVSITTTT
ncbi:MAG: potassium transporter TrkG, partial [Candidatus Omnitrophota bacterium]